MVGCVLTAAGLGVRMGGNKLASVVCGKRLIDAALELYGGIPFDVRVAVIPPDCPEMAAAAERNGFLPTVNPRPADGLASSVKTGLSGLLKAASGAESELSGVLFAAADQPGMTAAVVSEILAAAESNPGKIIVPVTPDGKRGNPVLFPAAFFEELLNLTGDVGGRTVLRRHPELVLTVTVPHDVLTDIDTPEDILRYEERFRH